jgi:hypothetical protein
MSERQLELRLQAVARTLDAHAPALDVRALDSVPRRRIRSRAVALVALAAFLGVVAAPAAVSGLRYLFDVDEVPELGPVPPDVAPPFEGRAVPVEAVQAAAPFRVRLIPSLGPPDAAHVRDDIAGGMVTVTYGARLLTQWRAADVEARIAVVPVGGTAEDVAFGGVRGLWIEGTARGTFTLVGADGAMHREGFEVSPGALLWKADGMAFLLQGAGSRADAIRLAAAVR